MNLEQFDKLMEALDNLAKGVAEIRDRMPAIDDQIDAQAAATVEKVSLGQFNTAAWDNYKLGAAQALDAMANVAKGWAEGAAENEEAMSRRDRRPAKDQVFFLADILNMINGAAREVGVPEVKVKPRA